MAVFIGNSIFGDDQIGLIIGNIPQYRLEKLDFDVQIIERTGFALLDCLEGYESAVVVDSVCTGRSPVGEILSFLDNDFRSAKPAAPRFSIAPEAVQLMRELNIDVPNLSIEGINVRDPSRLSDEISDDLKRTTDIISRGVYDMILALARTGAGE